MDARKRVNWRLCPGKNMLVVHENKEKTGRWKTRSTALCPCIWIAQKSIGDWLLAATRQKEGTWRGGGAEVYVGVRWLVRLLDWGTG